MFYTQGEIDKALKELSNNYLDEFISNYKSIDMLNENPVIENEKYIDISMKRSNLNNFEYNNCLFKNVSFTGSVFNNMRIKECIINGTGFAYTNFSNTKFITKKYIFNTANNFNQSNFTNCYFLNMCFKNTSFLQTLFFKCEFENNIFKSNTLEGTKFVNCKIKNVDFSNTNIEFVEFLNTDVKNTVFPFYQFPYIIGASNFIKNSNSNISLKVGNKIISIKEYTNQIDNLILFFYNKNDYFPIFNLQIAKMDILSAKETMKDGIKSCLRNYDYRMIKYFCRLAKYHNLLDDINIQLLINNIEEFLGREDIPPERLNSCITHTGEIKNILQSGNIDNITLNLNIKTNVDKNNRKGLKYVNSLCNDLNIILSQNSYGQTGFQISISNHSPFEIIVEIVSFAASIATIADILWEVIDKHKNEKYKDYDIKKYKEINQDLYVNYIDNRIELCKEQLLNIKKTYSHKRMNKYIEEITQQLKTDLTDLYDQNIIIFKKKNK